MPRLGSTDESRLRLAAGLIIADLEFTQSESIAHPDDLRRVSFNTSTAAWSILSASGNTTPITDPITRKPYATTFGNDRAATLKDVTIKTISVGGDSDLGFGVYGQLDQTAAATVTLACGARSVTITIDPITGEAAVGAIK